MYQQGFGRTIQDDVQIQGIDSEEFSKLLGPYADDVRAELELVRGAAHPFDLEEYLAGVLTPAFWHGVGQLRRARNVGRFC